VKEDAFTSCSYRIDIPFTSLVRQRIRSEERFMKASLCPTLAGSENFPGEKLHAASKRAPTEIGFWLGSLARRLKLCCGCSPASQTDFPATPLLLGVRGWRLFRQPNLPQLQAHIEFKKCIRAQFVIARHQVRVLIVQTGVEPG